MNFALARELAEKQGKEFVGQPTAKCPPTKSCLMVVVYKADTKEVISGATVQVSGVADSAAKKGSSSPSFRAENTKEGIAKFTPFDPGSYSIEVSVARLDGYEKPELVSQSVSAGTCPVAVVEVQPLPKLKVKVVERGNHNRVFEDAVVKVTGPQNHPDGKTKKSDGTADFGKTKSGKYVAQVTSLLEKDRQEYILPKDKVEETLAAGDDKTIIIEVYKINVVTPKIELEYKVVLLERNLSQYQSNTEDKIFADPTYIQLSYRETNSRYSFAKKGKGKVKFSPANVEVYQDEKCKKKFPGDPGSGINVTGEQLANLTGLKMYLRGKTAGKFDVQLELENPGDEHIRLKDNPATEKMGVVELKLKVHQYEASDLEALKLNPDDVKYQDNLKQLDLPKQQELTDENKIKVGRYLHVQSEKNNDRARLLIVKLEASQWPDGTDDYDITLDAINTSGECEIYEKQYDENDSSNQPIPVATKVSALKANEKELWAEGNSACNARRGVRLHLGLDRAEGGLPKTPKRNGDWARFTVVEIKEVKVDYKPEAGKAVAWDEEEKRFYINFKDDPDGRKITIGAELTEKISGVTLHFMLAPDNLNMKKENWGVDFPKRWKWNDITADVKHKDKSERQNVIHLSAKTDANGYAKKELVLSRFGGDKFHPAAYLDQDPHLAKYVHGHRILEKREPVFMKGHPLQVWRKFWYQEIKVRRLFVKGFGNAADTYKDVYAVMEAMEVKEMDRATANGLSPKVIYPKHMVSYYRDRVTNAYVNNYPNDKTDALVIGDANESKFFALKKAESDKPVMIPMVNAHGLWIADGVTGDISMTTWEEGATIVLQADKKLLNPPLQGGNLLNIGNWEAQDWDPTRNAGRGRWVNRRSGALAASNTSLKADRNDPTEFQVTKPAGIAGGARTRWRVTGLTLNAATRFLGTSYDDGIVNAYFPNDEVDFINTINHEIGHSFKQVAKTRPAGIPRHPHQYDKQGSHCRYKDNSCLMYESGPQQVHLDRYCPVCHPYVLVEDMSKVKGG